MTESIASGIVEGCYADSVNGSSAVLVCHYMNFHCRQNPKSYATGSGSSPTAGFETTDTGHFDCITDS
jgi:hypothetical protein